MDSEGVLLITFSVFVTVIFVCNLLVVVLYIKKRNLRSRSNMLAVSSALCCIFIVFVFIPVNVIDEIAYGLTIPWQQVVKGHVSAFETMLLLLNTVALSYDRYIIIIYGIRYDEIITEKKMRIMVAAIWLISFILSVIPLAWSLTVTDNNIVVLLFNIYQGLISLFIFLLFASIIGLYVRIYRKQNQQWGKDIQLKALRRRLSSKLSSGERSVERYSGDCGSIFSSAPTSPCARQKSIRGQRSLSFYSTYSQRRSSFLGATPYSTIKVVDENNCPVTLTDSPLTSQSQISERCSVIIGSNNIGSLSKVHVPQSPPPRERLNSWRRKKTSFTQKIASKVYSMRCFIVIFLVTVLCWLPIFLINILEALRFSNLVSSTMVTLSKFSFLTNCLINPLIYNLCSRNSRKGLRMLTAKLNRSSSKASKGNSVNSRKPRSPKLQKQSVVAV